MTETTIAAPAPAEETSVVPWIIVGSAAGLAVAGAIFTSLAAEELAALEDIGVTDDPCPNGPCTEGLSYGDDWQAHDDAKDSYQTVAGVLYGLAGAGLVAGVVLFAMAPSETPQEASVLPTIHIAPAPGGVTGHASWRF